MALTDPARELASTLEKIGAPPNTGLDTRIAELANVDPWSLDFFKILFEILNRFELLEREIRNLPLDEDIRQDALKSLAVMKAIFKQKNFLNQKTDTARQYIVGSNPTILKMLSSQIRDRISYHLFTDEEIEQILSDVGNLIDWLEGIQSEEKDFIRDALIKGLKEFQFRFERLEWFGSGYTIDSLRDIIQAYMALEGATVASQDGRELMEAILAKTRAFVAKVLATIDVTKDVSEKADWALKAYGAVSAIVDGSETIAGLLT